MDSHPQSRKTKKVIRIVGIVAASLGLIAAILYVAGVLRPIEKTAPRTSSFGYEAKAVRSDESAKIGEMAQRQYFLGDVDGAIATLDKALENASSSSPDRLYLLRDKGNIELSAGRFDAAIATYKLAVAVDDNNAVTHEGLGQAYQSAGRKDEARAEYQRQLELAKRSNNETQVEDATRNLQDINA